MGIEAFALPTHGRANQAKKLKNLQESRGRSSRNAVTAVDQLRVQRSTFNLSHAPVSQILKLNPSYNIHWTLKTTPQDDGVACCFRCLQSALIPAFAAMKSDSTAISSATATFVTSRSLKRWNVASSFSIARLIASAAHCELFVSTSSMACSPDCLTWSRNGPTIWLCRLSEMVLTLICLKSSCFTCQEGERKY